MGDGESTVSPCTRNNEGEEREREREDPPLFVPYPKSVGELNQRKEEKDLNAPTEKEAGPGEVFRGHFYLWRSR